MAYQQGPQDPRQWHTQPRQPHFQQPQGQPPLGYGYPPPRRKSNAGLILVTTGAAALLLFGGCAALVGLVGESPQSADTIAATGTDAEPAEKAGEEAEKPTTASSKKKFTAGDYKVLSPRGFAKLVKNPDVFKGEKFIIYGEVTQFDAATGNDIFRANSGGKKMQPEYGLTSYDQNSLFTGSKDQLSDVVEGDVFQAYATVLGSYSYDTQIGGNTTVRVFR
ncbi:hypothetical protein [Nonomuraea sp. NPDC048826]|uniref:hypothetical protein n=1 Tax=Nonomuraea sp. NPDC048826 TaxID=3364347 RepID=UPI00371FE2D3